MFDTFKQNRIVRLFFAFSPKRVMRVLLGPWSTPKELGTTICPQTLIVIIYVISRKPLLRFKPKKLEKQKGRTIKNYKNTLRDFKIIVFCIAKKELLAILREFTNKMNSSIGNTKVEIPKWLAGNTSSERNTLEI